MKIAVIGLGYVGLPLAKLFASRYPTVGYDSDTSKLDSIVSADTPNLACTSDPGQLGDCNFYIIAVPTPVDCNRCPDLRPLISASETVAKHLRPGDYVVYESTVYPGVTEEECVPVLERLSGLRLNKDFFVGYSPERINPGDNEHTVEKIMKVTSGSCPEAAIHIDRVYNSVLTRGTYMAPSIKVAEAAKIIENCQRDVNIAFMNELAKIFNAMGIDTHDVIEAASTKWNFMKFSPGLVGGHCISVDPYYLIQKAKVYGVLPRVMSSARQLNDSMGAYVAEQSIKLMNKKGVMVKDAPVLILGITFKENCADIRNSKVADIYHSLLEYTGDITVVDPWADAEQVRRELGIEIEATLPPFRQYSLIILAVAHRELVSANIKALRAPISVVYDAKGVLDRSLVDGRL